jgi:DNA (cytosine-5)-methyltransferase 1
MFTAGSLFSGIGGIDLAASLTGFDICFQVEINPFCQKVLRKHADVYWPNATLHADVRGLSGLPHTDILFGGFPCPDISRANRTRTGIQEGERSGLWFEFARIIGEIRPRIVFVENVEGILSNGDGWRITAQLATMGYVGQAGIISAADFGFSHIHERWFLVAYADSHGQRQSESTQHAESALHQNRNYSLPERCGEAVATPVGRGYQDSRANSAARQSRMEPSIDGLPGWMVRRIRGWNEPAQDWEAPRTTPTKHPMYRQTKEATGNGVVPQVVYPIFKALHEKLSAEVRHGS